MNGNGGTGRVKVMPLQRVRSTQYYRDNRAKYRSPRNTMRGPGEVRDVIPE